MLLFLPDDRASANPSVNFGNIVGFASYALEILLNGGRRHCAFCVLIIDSRLELQFCDHFLAISSESINFFEGLFNPAALLHSM